MKKALLVILLMFGGWVTYPQSTIQAQTNPQNVFISGTITTTGSTCSTANACVVAVLPLNTQTVFVSIVASAGFSGTLQFEVSVDGVVTPSAVTCFPPNSTTGVTSVSGNGSWSCSVSGIGVFDVRGSTVSTGSILVKIGISKGQNIAGTSSGGGGGGGSSNCPGAGGTANAFLVDSGTQGTCTDGSLKDNGSTVTGTEPLLISTIIDGAVPITITTGTTGNLGSTYLHGYTFNQEATAGTGVTYTLPATATGKQYCVANSGTTSVVNTGVLTVYPPSGSFVIYNGVVNTIGGGGTHGIASGGAAGDGACFVAIDSTHWQVYVQSGTWTEN